MKSRVFPLIAVVALLAGTLSLNNVTAAKSEWQSSAPVYHAALDSRLSAQLADPKLAASSAISAFVWLAQADSRNQQAGFAAQGGYVYDRLRAAATSLQPAVASQLAALQAQGEVSSYRAYWIVNGFYVEGSRAAIDQLASNPAVLRISASNTARLQADPTFAQRQRSLSPAATGWNLDIINAPQVWAAGDRGAGATVGVLDSGVAASHPALSRQYRGATLLPGNDYNWFDPLTNAPAPLDDNGHGTHSAGLAVGEESGLANQVGVAPAANWIACRAFDATGLGSDPAILACLQWMLAPTTVVGGSPNPALRPRVLLNSWFVQDGNDSTYRAAVQSLTNAGVLVIAPAGDNDFAQPACAIAAPGSYAESLAVGATNSEDRIADFSCAGPGLAGPKPEVSAPGVGVRSSVPVGSCLLCDPSGYRTTNGTGSAAAHLAGAAALLFSRNPAISLAQASYALTTTAHFSAEWGLQPSPLYGWGRLDVLAAYAAIPAPGGVLVGRVTAAGGGLNAAVRASGSGSYTTGTDASGYYTIALATGNYSLSVSSFGYIAQGISVTASAGVTATQDFSLAASQLYTVSGTAFGPTGAAAGLVSVAGSSYTGTASNGNFSLSLPQGTYTIRYLPDDRCLSYGERSVSLPNPAVVDILLNQRRDSFGYGCRDDAPATWITASNVLTPNASDDGYAQVALPFAFSFYGQSQQTAYVSTNGMISFGLPITDPLNTRIPNAAAPNNAIYGFWDDLTFQQQGRIYTSVLGVAPNRRFVVEWWRAQHYGPQPYGEYSFELILDEGTNAISAQYLALSGIDGNGSSATVGIEAQGGSTGLLYSYNQAALSSELLVRYTVSSAATATPSGSATVPPASTSTATASATVPPGSTATATATACTISFSDVPPNYLFYSDIQFLACRGVIGGFPGGTFQPNSPTSRGQFAKIAVLGFGIAAYTPAAPTFRDVGSGSVFYRYVEAANHAGAVNGLAASQCVALGVQTPCYGPNVNISRVQVGVIVQRVKNYASYTPANATFADLPTTAFGYAAVETLAHLGIINGGACGPATCFRPNDNIRRGELSKVVRRAIEIP